MNDVLGHFYKKGTFLRNCIYKIISFKYLTPFEIKEEMDTVKDFSLSYSMTESVANDLRATKKLLCYEWIF